MRSDRSRLEGCPDDERLAAFAEGALTASDREALEPHLAACPTCLDVVAALLPPTAGERMVRTPATVPVTPPARRRRGFRRWAIAAALALATSAVLAASFQSRLAQRVASLGSSLLGVPIQAETIAVTRAGDRSAIQITLGNVSFGAETGRRVNIEELGVTMALAAPLRGEPVLAAIRAVRPVVVLPRGTTDPWSWGDGARVVSALGRVGRVELVDARVELPLRGGTLAITAIDGEVRQTAQGREVALTGRAGDGDVAVTGMIASDGGLALTIGGRGLDAGALPVLSGRVTGYAELRLDVRGDAEHPRLDGRLALRDGRLIGVRPLWTMPLSNEMRALLRTLRPSLAGEDFPFDELRASYEWRDGRWRLPQVYIEKDGLLAGGRAQVDRAGTVRGKGTLRVPEDVVTAVEPLAPALAEARDPAGTATVPFSLAGRVSAPRLDLDRR